MQLLHLHVSRSQVPYYRVDRSVAPVFRYLIVHALP